MKIIAFLSETLVPSAHWVQTLLGCLVKQKSYWSSERAKRGFIYLPSMFATFDIFILIVAELAGSANRGILLAHPMLPFKYLSSYYISTAFETESRAFALLHNYQFMRLRLTDAFLADVFYRKATILHRMCGNLVFRFSLSLASQVHKEGELSLLMHVNDVDAYVMFFSFVPGEVIGIEAETAILIGRIQGVRGRFDTIRAATKAAYDVSPPAMLFATLQGIADALGLDRFGGIAARDHVARSAAPYPDLARAYDDFFTGLGCIRNAQGLFIGAFRSPQKPLANIARHHRRRARQKRAFKQGIADAAFHAVRANCVSASRRDISIVVP